MVPVTSRVGEVAVGDRIHQYLQRTVPVYIVGDLDATVAGQSRTVGKEMPDRDRRGGAEPTLDGEARKIVETWRVEVDFSLVDQTEGFHRREDLLGAFGRITPLLGSITSLNSFACRNCHSAS